MFTTVKIFFKSDLSKANVPYFYYKANDTMDIYERIMSHTNNHELAEEVSSWAELAGIGEEYDCDELCADIIDEE